MLGASVEQIESAIGLVVAHHVPFRAIRSGHQLSDSKGASAAISAELAVTSMRRAMRGFVGPADIFRNPQALFCLFEKPARSGLSPFDLTLAVSGSDFAIMGMHFKLGLYEHQSAGAIQGLIDILAVHPGLLDNPENLRQLRVTIYEPAFGIICDPAKRDPRNRQSADHSMAYILATLLRKAFQSQRTGWKELMLLPEDYADKSLFDPLTRRLMERIDFQHGGREYDEKYPDGIPTTVEVNHARLGLLTSGLIMYPEGHARRSDERLLPLLEHKFEALAGPAVEDFHALKERWSGLARKSVEDVRSLYAFTIRDHANVWSS
jgi:2-methylcitrate dehydratase